MLAVFNNDLQTQLLLREGGYRLVARSDINDFISVERPWTERFFSKPWRPWQATKLVRQTKFVRVGDTIYCSHLTLRELRGQA